MEHGRDDGGIYGLYTVRAIGWVDSSLTERDAAPRQGDEGAPDAWLVLEPSYAAAMHGLIVGGHVIVLTWLHLAERGVLSVHPRGDLERPSTGVFATRSPDRPNPVGLHRVEIIDIVATHLLVHPLEAIHGTPVIDIKPVLGGDESH